MKYSRQTILPQIGAAGQEKLKHANILVVGAGGLGCAVLPYLVAAGVGQITIIDGDVVEESNLHRQVLFQEQHIGQNKALIAKQQLEQQNSNVQLTALPNFLDAEQALQLFPQHDFIVDATDRLPIRYLMNDACVMFGKPLVHASIHQFEGQVAVFNHNGSATYRCLYPTMPDTVVNCAEAGVLGTAVAIIGGMQAQEVIKLIVGIEPNLSGKLLQINTLNYQQRIFTIQRQEVEKLSETDFLDCHQAVTPIALPDLPQGTQLIDVREIGEQPILSNPAIQNYPLSSLQQQASNLDKSAKYGLFCRSGNRSKKAYFLLKSIGFQKLYVLQENAPDFANFEQ